jgi:hypothetical protein
MVGGFLFSGGVGFRHAGDLDAGNGMAASIKRIICKALPEIIQSKDATTSERLEACRLLWKIRASATKGKPRGRGFAKKEDQRERIDRLIAGAN